MCRQFSTCRNWLSRRSGAHRRLHHPAVDADPAPELEADFQRQVYLKAARDGTIVGAVSGYEQNGACLIGRLIATPTARSAFQHHPTLHKHAANLLGGDWARHELFTSERSTRNLYLYQKLGYHTFRTERLTAKVTIVYLEKINLLSDSA